MFVLLVSIAKSLDGTKDMGLRLEGEIVEYPAPFEAMARKFNQALDITC